MNRTQSSTLVAGIDVSKRRLDVAVGSSGPSFALANDAVGRAELGRRLGELGVERVGLEASGGYEQAVVGELTAMGFEVVRHQPLEVRLFARLRRQRAKNDRLDARLIAAATAALETLKAAADPRLIELAQRLTAYEQAADLVSQIGSQLEHIELPDLVDRLRLQLDNLKAHKQALARDLERRLCADPELGQRFELLRSLPGFGAIVAMAATIRMPELGRMDRGQPAAMLGAAPFDRDSGARKGQRSIAGGRRRLRRLVYLAALAARRCDPSLKAFADRLAAAGKPPKVVIVAVMRKLIEAANRVLARQQPWIKIPA